MRDTKKLKKYKTIFLALSILFTYVPIIIFFVIGFIHSNTVQKLSLSGTCVAAIILGILSVLKYKSILKSVIWVILVGLCLAIENMSTVIIICGVCDIISELIFMPAYKHYAQITAESANADDTSIKIANALKSINWKD